MKPCFPVLIFAAQFLIGGGLPVAAIAAASSQPAMPMPTVNGTVHFGPQKAKINHVYHSQKQSDEGPITALLFSSEPIPAKVVEDRQKRQQLAKKGAFLGLYVEIDAEGQMKQSELLHKEGPFSGPWQFEPAKGKKAGIGGRIATEGQREFFGKPYAVDMTFSVDAKSAATWGGSPFLETKATGLALGQAEGWMVRAGKKTEFTHAIGLVERNLFGESGERILLLSAKPVTEEMLAKPRGPERALHEAGIAFLKLRLDSKGEIESMMAPSDDGQAMSFSGNQWNVDLVTTPATELEGYLEALEEREAVSEFPRFQLRFHAGMRTVGPAGPVTAENGKPLPKDGGEPGKAYRAFAQALQNAKSIEELLPLRIKLLEGQLQAIPPSERPRMLGFLKQQGRTPIAITGGFANETQATLWLEGKQDDTRMTGRVNVHREDGTWKLGAESFRMTDASVR